MPAPLGRAAARTKGSRGLKLGTHGQATPPSGEQGAGPEPWTLSPCRSRRSRTGPAFGNTGASWKASPPLRAPRSRLGGKGGPSRPPFWAASGSQSCRRLRQLSGSRLRPPGRHQEGSLLQGAALDTQCARCGRARAVRPVPQNRCRGAVPPASSGRSPPGLAGLSWHSGVRGAHQGPRWRHPGTHFLLLSPACAAVCPPPRSGLEGISKDTEEVMATLPFILKDTHF